MINAENMRHLCGDYAGGKAKLICCLFCQAKIYFFLSVSRLNSYASITLDLNCHPSLGIPFVESWCGDYNPRLQSDTVFISKQLVHVFFVLVFLWLRGEGGSGNFLASAFDELGIFHRNSPSGI